MHDDIIWALSKTPFLLMQSLSLSFCWHAFIQCAKQNEIKRYLANTHRMIVLQTLSKAVQHYASSPHHASEYKG